MEFREYLNAAEALVIRGGPEPEEYEELTLACQNLNEMNLSLEDTQKLHRVLKPILNKDSVIGFSYLKPHGYSGDFEIINKMYQRWVSPDKNDFHKWDGFFHNLHSVRAVRNRKQYLINELNQLIERVDSPRVLNLASGPCSDLHQFFIMNPKTKIHFDCLDMDRKAIDFGSCVCDNYIDSITFINMNAFKYNPTTQYDLIWSAGLFDYFSDKLFIRLLRKMYRSLSSDGKLVVGNFSDYNPSRGAMEILGQWYLHHRSEDTLIDIAIKAGISRNKINVHSEGTGVNLFLHLNK